MKVAQIKEFTLHDKTAEHKGLFYVRLQGELFSKFIARDINGAIAEFIRLIEEWQGYKF